MAWTTKRHQEQHQDLMSSFRRSYGRIGDLLSVALGFLVATLFALQCMVSCPEALVYSKSVMTHDNPSEEANRLTSLPSQSQYVVLDMKRDPRREAAPKHENIGPVVLAGLARTTAEMQNSTWKVLSDLSCQHNVSIQLTVFELTDIPTAYPICALLDIQKQDVVLGNKELPENRLGRLAMIRDAQRSYMQTKFFPQQATEGFVIILDLDMYALPTAEKIWSRVQIMQGDPKSHVICGNGNWYDHPRLKGNTMFYYDTLALVFLPDTWALYQKSRLIPYYYPGENKSLVPDSVRKLEIGELDAYTQYDTMKHILQQASKHDHGVAPVRSCFGGLAIYKAATWLNPSCKYTANIPKGSKAIISPEQHKRSILRYAKKGGLLPCEHVALHDCLHRKVFHTGAEDVNSHSVAIDPGLLTQWLKGEESH